MLKHFTFIFWLLRAKTVHELDSPYLFDFHNRVILRRNKGFSDPSNDAIISEFSKKAFELLNRLILFFNPDKIYIRTHSKELDNVLNQNFNKESLINASTNLQDAGSNRDMFIFYNEPVNWAIINNDNVVVFTRKYNDKKKTNRLHLQHVPDNFNLIIDLWYWVIATRQDKLKESMIAKVNPFDFRWKPGLFRN